ncbi:MAG: hypothetical protein M3539_15250 [Acidobacteriota bacterium]|nr:hypothetical protein [Acidobacteriota bacterium]
MLSPSVKLVHLLIGKSILETLLVGTLAVFSFLSIFPPNFHGWGEVTSNRITGWAVNNAAPWDRVEVQVFVDGRFVVHGVANLSRPDVRAAGWARDEWHGYAFHIGVQSPGPHEARVYALHDSGDGKRKSLQLLGDPIPFLVDDGGNLQTIQKK